MDMEWLEAAGSDRATIEPSDEGMWTGGAFAIDEGLWMADWDAEFVDRRNYEDQVYGGWAVEEIRKEAQAALRWDGTFPASAARGPRCSYSNICKEVDKKMKFDVQSKLDEYLRLLEQIKQKTTDERTAVALLQEVSKDRRSAEIREERETKSSDTNTSQPATEKQKQFMKKLGIKFPATVTKQEASLMIDEERGRNGE
jgi:hypothetical protein